MQFALSMPNFGVGLDAGAVAEAAAAAEAAGWDAFFLWDHTLAFEPGAVDLVDPWIALAVAATRTTRIRLGTAVPPLPRRRPVTVARQVVTLDGLARGRVTLGVGIGAMPFEWEHSGEEPDPVVRGDMLDEALDVLARLWAAQPIWVAGTWLGEGSTGGRPLRRAARWDGVLPMRLDGGWTPRDTERVAAVVSRHRGSLDGFDVAVPGGSDASTPARVGASHADAGATWWVEALHPWRYGVTAGGPWPWDAMTRRIAEGPPGR